MRYWQIAAGGYGRDYADKYFLRHGLAFVGGKPYIERLKEIEVEDRIFLKCGASEVRAIGKVEERAGKHGGVEESMEGERGWLMDFDGWELPAYCFVEWHEVPEAKRNQPRLVRRGTIKAMHDKGLKDLAEQILVTPARQLEGKEPQRTKQVTDEEIIEFLMGQGLRPGAAEELSATLNRVRRLAHYYYHSYGEKPGWDYVREHETRTFLIVPLLLALGWAEQQIKIELSIADRRRVDIACFPKPYPMVKDEECCLVVESKGFSQGLDYAAGQAKAYAQSFPACQVVSVSNGYCYKAFARLEDGSFAERPTAYVNLLKPRDKYPLDPQNVEGALEALRLLLPPHLSQDAQNS